MEAQQRIETVDHQVATHRNGSQMGKDLAWASQVLDQRSGRPSLTNRALTTDPGLLFGDGAHANIKERRWLAGPPLCVAKGKGGGLEYNFPTPSPTITAARLPVVHFGPRTPRDNERIHPREGPLLQVRRGPGPFLIKGFWGHHHIPPMYCMCKVRLCLPLLQRCTCRH